jgi:hypothetical protein
MTGGSTLRHATVAALSLHVGLGTVSTLLFLAAFQLRADWFADPVRVVEGGAASAALLRWGSVTDLFSYYLPMGLVAVALWFALRRRGQALALIGLLGALGYALLGGAGASVLALVGAPLIEAYGGAGADQAAIRATFAALVGVVFRAIWQFLDAILLSVWMASVGVLLATDHASVARLSLTLAGLSGLGAVVNLLGLDLARDALLGVMFVLWAAWSIALAGLVWRGSPPFDALDVAADRP